MKLAILLFALVASCSATNSQFFNSTLLQIENEPETRQQMADAVAHLLLNLIYSETETVPLPRAPVLPEFKDPLNIKDVTQTLPTNGPFSSYIYGSISICGNAVAKGLSTIKDDLVLTAAIPPSATYDISATDISITGEHDLDMTILGKFLRLVSNGEFSLRLTNGVGKVQLVLSISGGVITITKATIDLSFGSLTVTTTKAQASDNGGELHDVDWTKVNAEMKKLFDEAWVKVKPVAELAIATIGSQVLKKCKIQDLIDKKYDCLKPTGVTGQSLDQILSKSSQIGLTADGPTCKKSSGSGIQFNLFMLLATFTFSSFRFFL